MIDSFVDSESGLQPSAIETDFLILLNKARSNPKAYGQIIGLNLDSLGPLPALIMDARLVQSARGHAVDMAEHNYFDHNDRKGHNPSWRITAAGFPWSSWGECIAAGSKTAADVLKQLIIDRGTVGVGHRKALLGIGQPYSSFNCIGVGQGIGGAYGVYWCMDICLGRSKPVPPAPDTINYLV